MRQGREDYTRKTQEIAQERRYFANLDADLEKVRNNPSLAEEFKRIYPEQYHNFLRYTQSNSATRPQSAASGQATNVDPELMSRFERLERAHQEREVAAINSERLKIYLRSIQRNILTLMRNLFWLERKH